MSTKTTTTTVEAPVTVATEAPVMYGPEDGMTVVTVAGTAFRVAKADTYRCADKADKASYRAGTKAALEAAIEALDVTALPVLNEILKSYSTKVAPAPVEVDWDGIISQRVADLRAAIVLLVTGEADIEGMPEGRIYTVTEDGIEADNEAAISLATIKAGSTKRQPLGQLMAEVAEKSEAGTFYTVAQLAAACSSDDYKAGSGAVAARLFPSSGTCTLTAWTPVAATSTSPRGAIVATKV